MPLGEATVANDGGENSNLDDLLKLPDDETPASESNIEPMAEFDAEQFAASASEEDGLLAGEGIGEPAATEEAAALPGEPIETEAAATEAEPEKTEEEKKTEEEEAEEAEKEPYQLPPYVEWGGAIGIPLILLVLGWFQIIYFSTAIYLIAVGFIPYGIWKGRATNTVFTVFLACALAAVLTGLYCLWLEIGRYQFDVKAREAKHRISMSQSVPPRYDAGLAGPWM
jgi:hypothetical protein